MNHIYSLCCPYTGAVRYIGRTSNLKTRLSTHISLAKNGRSKNIKLSAWINELLAKGKQPVMVNLMTLKSAGTSAISSLEQWFINKHYSPDLLNIELTDIKHKAINVIELRRIKKKHKLTTKSISVLSGISTGLISTYLRNTKYKPISFEKALHLQSVIRSMAKR